MATSQISYLDIKSQNGWLTSGIECDGQVGVTDGWSFTLGGMVWIRHKAWQKLDQHSLA